MRLAHIATLKYALRVNGKAYFKIWPEGGEYKNSYQPTVKTSVSSSYQANAGADLFLREVQLVFGLDHVAIDPTIPNLIIAAK